MRFAQNSINHPNFGINKLPAKNLNLIMPFKSFTVSPQYSKGIFKFSEK